MDARECTATGYDDRFRDEGHRILIVADNELARRGLSEMLHSLRSVGGVDSVIPAPDGTLPDSAFDILVVACDDLTAPAPRRMAHAASGGGAKVLLLFNRRAGDTLDTVTRFPGNGFLNSDDLTETALEEALDRIAGGEIPMPAILTTHLLERVLDGTGSLRAEGPRLTPRERETLRLLAEGLSNKQIARRLLISQHGVKRLVANILAKLNCSNRTLAATVAVKQGLLDMAV